MIKELMLAPRVLYSIIFVLLGILTVFGVKNFDVVPFVGSLFFVFMFSFVWQYYVLHFALKMMNNKQRLITLLVWLIVSLTIILWGLNALANLDWLQDTSTLIKDFAGWMSVFLVGVSMFIGGACTRRAFEKHGAL